MSRTVHPAGTTAREARGHLLAADGVGVDEDTEGKLSGDDQDRWDAYTFSSRARTVRQLREVLVLSIPRATLSQLIFDRPAPLT